MHLDRPGGFTMRQPPVRFRSAWTRSLIICLWLGVVTVFAGPASQVLSASTTPVSGPRLIVHRSTRDVAHKFSIRPDGAKVTANQALRFEVTDINGNPVAVRWNVSGLDCFGASCGSIGEDGVYRTPSTLHQAHVVTVEGVLVSNPTYSVLTRVEILPASSATSAPRSTPTFASSPIPESPQLTAAIVADRSNKPDLAPSLSSTITGPPPSFNFVEGVRSFARPPLPNAVAAPPALGPGSFSPHAVSLPLQNVVAAAPSVESSAIARGASPLSLPTPVAAAPQVDTRRSLHKASLAPLPKVTAAPPDIQQLSIESDFSPLPVLAVAPPPRQVKTDKESASPSSSNYLAKAVAPPIIDAQKIDVGLQSAPAQSSSPKSSSYGRGQILEPSTASALKKTNAQRATLEPMPEEPKAASEKPGGAAPDAPGVSYRGGQLTIDAQNSTLADVLHQVAEKTGAEIDIPPGTGLERIVAHDGPGLAQDVLAQLLNGSPYDFIIVSSPQSPNAPAQVLLSLHRPDTVADRKPELPKAPAVSSLWTPPAPVPGTPTVYLPLDPGTLPPKEAMTPEVLGQLMREKGQALREQIQQQQPPQ